MVLVLTGCSGAPEDASCVAGVELEIMKTEAGVEFVRTPDACFENLPDWPYEPQYVEIDGLRQAYVDVGSGESGGGSRPPAPERARRLVGGVSVHPNATLGCQRQRLYFLLGSVQCQIIICLQIEPELRRRPESACQ